MSSFETRARQRMRITAGFSMSDEGDMTLRVTGFARKPGAGLVCLATSVPVEGIPGRAERRRLEETYVKRLIKRIREFERGEHAVPQDGSFIVESSQAP